MDDIKDCYEPDIIEDEVNDEITQLIEDPSETEREESGTYGAQLLPTSSLPTTQDPDMP